MHLKLMTPLEQRFALRVALDQRLPKWVLMLPQDGRGLRPCDGQWSYRTEAGTLAVAIVPKNSDEWVVVPDLSDAATIGVLLDLARVATLLRAPDGTWEADGYANQSLGIAVAMSLLATEKLNGIGQWSGR